MTPKHSQATVLF